MISKTPSTLEIAARAKPHHIHAVATDAGIRADEVEAYGSYKAKVSLAALDRLSLRPNGKLICVSGITPTKEGNGKTCTSIALTQALGLLKKKTMLCLREPSMAPIFGYKGGGTGGGRSQVLPMEDINLHFMGDMHAFGSAHNLLCAALENHIHHGNALEVSLDHIFWRRVMDIGDRQLREIIAGASKSNRFSKYRTGFDLTASSEVMAALSLSTSFKAYKNRLSKISAALNKKGDLITAKDLKVSGAMAILTKDTLKPNLVQTLEGQPAFLHTGPFANTSHGNNSVVSTLMALKLANYVVTESGFGTDLGLEKLFHLICPEGGIKPSVVVLVASMKALKAHNNESKDVKKITDRFRAGFDNMSKHIRNAQKFGLPVVIAINRFTDDTVDEIKALKDYLQYEHEDTECAVSDGFRLGGEGALELAEKVLKTIAEKNANFKPLYDQDHDTQDKITILARELYGAMGVEYTDQAKKDLETINRLKLRSLPVCVAKTPYSLSDNPNLKGAPQNWKLKVNRIFPKTGAGFHIVVAGKTMLMPGLPEKPSFETMDILDNGEVRGLF